MLHTAHDVTRLLSRFGLKPPEARIYLTCLRFPTGLHTVEIVGHTHLNRSSVNLMIERLEQQGFLRRVKRGARYVYSATPTEILLQKHENLLSDFRDLMPFLAKLGHSPQESEVRFFEGPAGIRHIYDICLAELKITDGPQRELLNIASGQDVLKIFPTLHQAFIKHRVRARIPLRLIAPAESQKLNGYDPAPPQLRAVRYFDQTHFPFRIDLGIFGNCVFMYSPLAPVSGMYMKNERVAASMRSLFNMLWGFLPV